MPILARNAYGWKMCFDLKKSGLWRIRHQTPGHYASNETPYKRFT